MIERQVIVTWETKKPPKPDIIVPVTVSLKTDHVTYDHAVVMADWMNDDDGWYFYDNFAQRHHDLVTVHAWADLKPYAGNIDRGEVHYEHG